MAGLSPRPSGPRHSPYHPGSKAVSSPTFRPDIFRPSVPAGGIDIVDPATDYSSAMPASSGRTLVTASVDCVTRRRTDDLCGWRPPADRKAFHGH